jgi:hypothetical protein
MTSDPQYAEAIELIEKRPGWALMTAYDRTKALLEILARKGLDAPNWAVIRAMIGKGSAGDINRAKREFRQELGVQLGRMRATKGMPDEVGDVYAKLWLLSVEHAAKAFDEQVNAFKLDLERAESALIDAEAQRDDALSRVQALEGEKAGLQASNQSLQALADTERAAKEQAQQMFDAARAELTGQLEQMQATLVRAQQETADALTRFEGMENRLQQEIDRARQELAAERERIRAERSKEQTTYETAKERANTQLGVERSKRQESDRKLAVALAEVAELRTQLTAAQAMIRTALQNGQTKTIQRPKAPTSRGSLTSGTKSQVKKK